jgi:hypothetical protein
VKGKAVNEFSREYLVKVEEVFDLVRRDVSEFKGNPDCEKCCAKTINMLSTLDEIDAICIHEAGHFIESIRLGVMVGFREKDIIYNAARVIHRPENLGSKFEANPGSIKTPFEADKVVFTVPLFEQIARVAVAGGVYANKLAGRPLYDGTGGDRELYETYYRKALKTLHANKDFKKASDFCKWATREVAADMKTHPELEQLARAKALEFRTVHYLPFVELAGLNR